MASDTQSLITTCVAVTVVTTIAADFFNQKANGKPSATEIVRPLIGGAIAGALLFGFAMLNERLAKDLAVLLALSAILKNGNGLFALLEKFNNTATTAAGATVTTTSGAASAGHVSSNGSGRNNAI